LSKLPEIRWSHACVLTLAGLAFAFSFRLNQLLDNYFVYAPGISLLFIPAGVKLLFVLLGRLPAVIGILIASVYLGAGIWPDKSIVTVFNFAFVSLMTYPVSAYVVMRAVGIHRDLYNLRYWHIVLLSLVATQQASASVNHGPQSH
jgi:glucose-6-phosphate-specific signal transduction histidine kinase